MKASELKAGKKVKFGKFEVGYDKRNKLYYAKRHFTSQRFVEVETFAELKEFISANNTRQLKGVADSKKSSSTKKTAPKKKTAKKSLSGTGNKIKITVKELPVSEQSKTASGGIIWKYGIYENGNLFAKRDTKANAERDAKTLRELSKNITTSKRNSNSSTIQSKQRKKEAEGWRFVSVSGYKNGVQTIVAYIATKGNRKYKAASMTALLKKI